jgi:hypothetical protein
MAVNEYEPDDELFDVEYAEMRDTIIRLSVQVEEAFKLFEELHYNIARDKASLIAKRVGLSVEPWNISGWWERVDTFVATTSSAAIDPRNHLKLYLLTQTEFDALPEYSLSKPTGVTDGKMWKTHRQASPNGRYMACWILCEYKIEGSLPVTYFYKPVIVDLVPEGGRRVWP